MKLSGKRFLVIGGAGLIGSHTVDALLEEDVAEVIIFDNFCRGTFENIKSALKDDRCSVFEAGGDIQHFDILRAAMKGIDGVFHFAALWLLQCYEYPRAAFEVNIKGTFNVLEACVAEGVERLVYSSSASVYGDALSVPMREDHPYNNTTFYGATKIAGEHMLRAFYHRYGLDYCGLRYMNVYGPRQDYKGAYVSVIMKILDRLDNGLPPVIFGDGEQAYDFVFVGDCARANVCAMKSSAGDMNFNVGTGRQTTLNELCRLILKLAGSRLEPVYEPAGKTFVTKRIADTEASRKQLAFEARTNLEVGLEKLIEWRAGHKFK